MDKFTYTESQQDYCTKCNEFLEPVRYGEGLQGFQCCGCGKIYDFLAKPVDVEKKKRGESLVMGKEKDVYIINAKLAKQYADDENSWVIKWKKHISDTICIEAKMGDYNSTIRIEKVPTDKEEKVDFILRWLRNHGYVAECRRCGINAVAIDIYWNKVETP